MWQMFIVKKLSSATFLMEKVKKCVVIMHAVTGSEI